MNDFDAEMSAIVTIEGQRLAARLVTTLNRGDLAIAAALEEMQTRNPDPTARVGALVHALRALVGSWLEPAVAQLNAYERAEAHTTALEMLTDAAALIAAIDEEIHA